MVTRRQVVLACTAAASVLATGRKAFSRDRVIATRVPENGLQPQVVVDQRGVTHLIYYAGDAQKGDVYYSHSGDGGATFSASQRVNSQAGSAIAAGTIRGAQLAVGKAGRVHVAWNGSMDAKPAGPLNPDSGKPGMPLLYSRLDDSGKAFEPQRSVMLRSFGLDGGGSIAADEAGNVYVAWHGIAQSEASGTGKEGEARRRVWVTKSQDGGRTFSTETSAWSQETGACGCCGMKLFSDRQGTVSALYRSATESVHRDIYLLTSKDSGRSFQGSLLHKWNINACPMSSMDLAANENILAAAWETGGQVFWSRIDRAGRASQPVSPGGDAKGRKHPRLAVNQDGEVLLAWTEGTGWQKGGSLAWQMYDRAGNPTAEKRQLPGIPTWSFAAAIARPDNSFAVIY